MTNPPSPQLGRRTLLGVVDDLGWGEVGACGQDVLQTPVLDRVAADGIRFDQAYATPICAPVRFGQWKAVRHNDRPTELYRLNRDLSETSDVAAAHPSVVRDAERLMARAVA